MKTIISSSFICYFFLGLVLAGEALAQSTIANTRIFVSDSGGSPLPNTGVRLYTFDPNSPHPQEDVYFSNASAHVNIPNLEEGIYEIELIPRRLPGSQTIAVFAAPQTVTLSMIHASYNPGTNTYSTSLSGMETTNFMQLRIEEGIMPFSHTPPELNPLADLVAGVEVQYNTFNFSNSQLIKPMSGPNGYAILPFPPTNDPEEVLAQEDVFINVSSPTHAGTSFVAKTQSASGRQTGLVRVPPRSAPTIFRFHSNGGGVNLPSNIQGHIECALDIAPHFVKTYISGGETQVNLTLPQGPTTCNFEAGTLSAQPLSFNAQAGSASGHNFVLINSDAPVRIRTGTLDANNNLQLLNDGHVACFNIWTSPKPDGSPPDVFDSHQACTTNGISQIQLLAHTAYSLVVDVHDPNSPHTPAPYKSLGQIMNFMTLDSGQHPVEVEAVLERLDASVTVRVPQLPNGNFNVFIEHNTEQQAPPSSPTPPGLNFGGIGHEIIPLKSGLEYRVLIAEMHGPPGDPENPPSNEGFIESQEVLITPLPDEDLSLTIDLPVPDYTLTVVPTLKDISGNPIAIDNLEFFGCFLEKQNGQGAGNFAENATSLNIALETKGEKVIYEVSCQGAIADGGQATGAPGSPIKKHVFGQLAYTSKSNVTTDSLTIELTEFGDYYDPEDTTVPLTNNENVKLPDGGNLFIPKGAFKTTTGDATFTIGSPKDISFSDSEFPVFAWELDVFVNGEEFSGEFDQPLILTSVLNHEEFIEKYGVEPGNFEIGVYDESSKQWLRTDGSITTEDNGDGTFTVTLSIEHFSIWGALISISKQLKQTVVSGLRIKSMNKKKNAKKKKMQLCWDEVQGANAYTLEYYKKTKKSKKAAKKGLDPWQLYAKSKSIAGDICTTLKLKSGKYFWRVQILDSELWSETKGMKVK